MLALPALVAVAVAAFGLLGISGSSLGVYGTDNGASEKASGVVAGPSRPIRSDEWLVRTPWVLRQVEGGLPDQVKGALGTHDADMIYDLPTKGLEVLLRPQTAVYRLLDAERAFAVEWWSLFALQLLGVYALLVTLTGRPGLSAAGASLMTLSPATQWWTTPATFTTVGWGCLATACAVRACRSGPLRRRLAWSAAAGAALASFLSALYPPWQVGVALVVVPTGGAAVVSMVVAARDRWAALRSLVVVGAAIAVVAGGLFLPYLAGHRPAVEAISSTVYPGQRVAAEGGYTPMSVVLSSTFDSFGAARPFAMVNQTNQSENSSVLPLLLPAAAAAMALAARRLWAGSALAAPLAGCLLGGGIAAGWMLLYVPASVGRFLLLNRVAGQRLILPVGLAGVVALTLVAARLTERRAGAGWWVVSATSAGLGALLWWEANRYTVEDATTDFRAAAVLVGVVVAGVALALSRRPLLGLGLLSAFSLWQASLINPLQHGTGPLTDSALRRTIERLRPEAPGAAWIAFGADATVRGTMTAAGVDNLSGVSPYPDRAAWRALDPQGVNEESWNRYAHLSFVPGPPGSPATFALRGIDDMVIAVDPCAPALDRLGVGFMVAQGLEITGCGRPVARLPHRDSFLIVYRR